MLDVLVVLCDRSRRESSVIEGGLQVIIVRVASNQCDCGGLVDVFLSV